MKRFLLSECLEKARRGERLSFHFDIPSGNGTPNELVVASKSCGCISIFQAGSTLSVGDRLVAAGTESLGIDLSIPYPSTIGRVSRSAFLTEPDGSNEVRIGGVLEVLDDLEPTPSCLSVGSLDPESHGEGVPLVMALKGYYRVPSLDSWDCVDYQIRVEGCPEWILPEVTLDDPVLVDDKGLVLREGELSFVIKRTGASDLSDLERIYVSLLVMVDGGAVAKRRVCLVL
ncbi:hypothetical protein M4951_16545 [Blastopirellula sp. J2-11]|uniref:hypothetical protein n=1 Tax=Blastopirellula sp. J2-11 TaxID=2943192 RepID=UPI0021C96EE4|nr:hypothetical protein [Blastopirellula sp. J2-11]UUO04989.1 hypothetical protein M4951_16545 [Blastopirellula sp. J2-11]